METLSVVCARAGSKGLKNKCIEEICGKMVVGHSVEYSLSLGDNVKTMVSTDIEELIDYCRKNNITHIKRDPRICTDESKIDDALADAIEKEGHGCEYSSLVYGNIPTRYPALFQEALHFLKKNKNYDAVISMQKVGKFHPEWMFDYNTDAIPKVNKAHYRRQMLRPKMIHDSHTIIFKTEGFLNRYKGVIPYDHEALYSIFGDRIKPLVNNEIIVDVDVGKDLDIAKAIILGQGISEKSLDNVKQN